MEWLIVAGFVLWVLAKSGSKKSKIASKATRMAAKSVTRKPAKQQESKQSPAQKKLEQAFSGWLRERWQLAENVEKTSDRSVIPDWFYHEITDRQKERLEGMGIELDLDDLSKGQASDIIGLMERPDLEHADMLKFFGHKLAGMSQTEARHRVAMYMADAEAMEQYENRPAAPIEKAIFPFFGKKSPPGLTHKQFVEFEAMLDEHADEDESSRVKLNRWYALKDGFLELNDPDTLEMYDLKKVSLKLYMQAYRQLEEAGGIDESGVFDDEQLVQHIIEINPDIEKI